MNQKYKDPSMAVEDPCVHLKYLIHIQYTILTIYTVNTR